MSFAENLKSLRKEKGITQEELAELLQVSRQAVSKWEAGSGYPETDKLLAIARELKVSLDVLMDIAPAANKVPQEAACPKTNKIVIATFDGSQLVDCMSVRYERLAFPSRNEPAYVLLAVDRVGFFGAHTVILGWYETEEKVKKEVADIVKAIDRGDTTYQLQYYTEVRFKGIFGIASGKKSEKMK